MLKIALDTLDLTDGRTSRADQYDIHQEHDGSVMILAHVGDEGIAIAFDPEGESLDALRAALDRPATSILLPNGRVLGDDEVLRRLSDPRNQNPAR